MSGVFTGTRLNGSRVEIVDLGHPLHQGIPTSPSHPGYRHALMRRHGDTVRVDGTSGANDLLVSAGAELGLDITLFYGPAWLLVMWVPTAVVGFHDVIVHRRLKHRYVPRSAYMKRIVQAHRLHHATEAKDGSVSFGFIWAPRPEALKAELARRGHAGLRAPSARPRPEA